MRSPGFPENVFPAAGVPRVAFAPDEVTMGSLLAVSSEQDGGLLRRCAIEWHRLCELMPVLEIPCPRAQLQRDSPAFIPRRRSQWPAWALRGGALIALGMQSRSASASSDEFKVSSTRAAHDAVQMS